MKHFKRITSTLLALSVFVFVGQGCIGGGGSTAGQTIPQVTLEYWRVFDGEESFRTTINAYRALHPNVRINYRRLRFDEYEQELLQAFAEGRGPDILSIHNTWMKEYQPLLQPMPASVTIVQQEQRGSLRKEVVNVAVEKPTISQKNLREQYVDTVPLDVILTDPDAQQGSADKIYGLPLSVDTLALFYNRDLLNSAGIATPATDWQTLMDHVETLTTLNTSGDVLQAGIPLGTAENVERSADILSLLMMQTGTNMTDERGRIAFHTAPAGFANDLPAVNALQFYTDFARPVQSVYTWNDDMPNSFEAFTNGTAAYFLGYSYHTPLIQTAAPRLNFGVSTVPQIAGSQEVNYANYWIETVSKQTEFSDWAWDFLQFASQPANVTSYLNATKKPTALRLLREEQLDDELIGPFAEQLLTAKTWYRGRDVGAAETALRQLINDILNGTYQSPEEALTVAANKVSQTL